MSAIGLALGHIEEHFCECGCGICRCPCEDCTTRTNLCVCLDCSCDEKHEDHAELAYGDVGAS